MTAEIRPLRRHRRGGDGTAHVVDVLARAPFGVSMACDFIGSRKFRALVVSRSHRFIGASRYESMDVLTIEPKKLDNGSLVFLITTLRAVFKDRLLWFSPPPDYALASMLRGLGLSGDASGAFFALPFNVEPDLLIPGVL